MEYRQEYYAGEAEDNGAVLSVDEQAEVPQRRTSGRAADRGHERPRADVLEYKFYAPDVGLVLTLDVSGGYGREELLSTSDVSERRSPGRAVEAPLGDAATSRRRDH